LEIATLVALRLPAVCDLLGAGISYSTHLHGLTEEIEKDYTEKETEVVKTQMQEQINELTQFVRMRTRRT